MIAKILFSNDELKRLVSDSTDRWTANTFVLGDMLFQGMVHHTVDVYDSALVECISAFWR